MARVGVVAEGHALFTWDISQSLLVRVWGFGGLGFRVRCNLVLVLFIQSPQTKKNDFFSPG